MMHWYFPSVTTKLGSLRKVDHVQKMVTEPVIYNHLLKSLKDAASARELGTRMQRHIIDDAAV